MRPVLMLEINEVPLRVYQKYSGDPRFPHVRRLLECAAMVETLITGDEELSPWCTWPTIHRGLVKKDHGVFHLGQDPTTFRGTPLWDEYLRRGLSVGVFGSLQSWPPRDPGAGGFYVPDTFAPTPECRPTWIEPIQRLNLGLVRENGRMMSESLVGSILKPGLIFALLRSGIRATTLLRSAAQVILERFRPELRQRRVTFQALLFWDIFRRLYRPERPPAFATFFTNHVASVEHRFWSHVFPEDFDEGLRPENREHLQTMDFAMKIVNEILGEAFAWRQRNPEIILVVANSMGQGARVARKHQGFELIVRDVPGLLASLGVPPGTKQNLAMAPQLSFDVSGVVSPERFITLLEGLTSLTGRKLLLCDYQNNTVNVTVFTPPAGEISGERVKIGNREVSLEEIGISKVKIDPGSAYHVPQGQIFVEGLAGGAVPAAVPIPAESVKSMILNWAGLAAPEISA